MSKSKSEEIIALLWFILANSTQNEMAKITCWGFAVIAILSSLVYATRKQ